MLSQASRLYYLQTRCVQKCDLGVYLSINSIGDKSVMRVFLIPTLCRKAGVQTMRQLRRRGELPVLLRGVRLQLILRSSCVAVCVSPKETVRPTNHRRTPPQKTCAQQFLSSSPSALTSHQWRRPFHCAHCFHISGSSHSRST